MGQRTKTEKKKKTKPSDRKFYLTFQGQGRNMGMKPIRGPDATVTRPSSGKGRGEVEIDQLLFPVLKLKHPLRQPS